MKRSWLLPSSLLVNPWSSNERSCSGLPVSSRHIITTAITASWGQTKVTTTQQLTPDTGIVTLACVWDRGQGVLRHCCLLVQIFGDMEAETTLLHYLIVTHQVNFWEQNPASLWICIKEGAFCILLWPTPTGSIHPVRKIWNLKCTRFRVGLSPIIVKYYHWRFLDLNFTSTVQYCK